MLCLRHRKRCLVCAMPLGGSGPRAWMCKVWGGGACEDEKSPKGSSVCDKDELGIIIVDGIGRRFDEFRLVGAATKT